MRESPRSETPSRGRGSCTEIIIYPGADHALFNDTGPRYNARAAADAWARTRAWFAQHLAP